MWQIFCCSVIEEVSFKYHQKKCEVQSLGLGFCDNVSVSKFESGFGLGGYGLDYATDVSIKLVGRSQPSNCGLSEVIFCD